jgi:hypothetical protein
MQRRRINKTLAYTLALGRTAVGVTGVVAPRFLMKFWSAADVDRQLVYSGLVVGVRDLVVGLGTLKALGRDEIGSTWAQFAALSDTVDSIGTLLFFDTPRGRRTFIVDTVGISAGVGWWLQACEGGWTPFTDGPKKRTTPFGVALLSGIS